MTTEAAAEAARAEVRDTVLSNHAERVVQILVDLNAAGCVFLDLAPLDG